jgi:hypothetical protein
VTSAERDADVLEFTRRLDAMIASDLVAVECSLRHELAKQGADAAQVQDNVDVVVGSLRAEKAAWRHRLLTRLAVGGRAARVRASD